MGGRKYCLTHLSDWLAQIWLQDASHQETILSLMIAALLHMDGLKQTWLVDVGAALDIAVKYNTVQEILFQVGAKLKYEGPMMKQVPWIENEIVFHRLVGKELPEEMRVHQLNKACGVRVPRFDPAIQSNFKYIPTRKQVKQAQKIHQFCAMAHGGISVSNPFKIVDVVKGVKPASDSHHAYLVIFAEQSTVCDFYLADLDGSSLCGSPCDTVGAELTLSRLIEVLTVPSGKKPVALALKNPFQDIAMLLAIAGSYGKRHVLEGILVKLPIFTVSEANYAEFVQMYKIVAKHVATKYGKGPKELSLSSLSLTDDFVSL